MVRLSEVEKQLLADGNRYTFAKIFCKNYKKIAKKNGFNENDYRGWIDWNNEDKMYTVWNKNGDKDFFNINFEYCGTKEY